MHSDDGTRTHPVTWLRPRTVCGPIRTTNGTQGRSPDPWTTWTRRILSSYASSEAEERPPDRLWRVSSPGLGKLTEAAWRRGPLVWGCGLGLPRRTIIMGGLTSSAKIVPGGGYGRDATSSTGTTRQVMGPGLSSAKKKRQNTTPISCPSVSSQLTTPGSRWATTTR